MFWTIESQNNNNMLNYHLSCRKEIYNEGIVLSLLELSDGRIASSTSDNIIKIWSLNDKNELVIDNKKFKVSFETCLVEGLIFKNDENTKQLISGGGNGKL